MRYLTELWDTLYEDVAQDKVSHAYVFYGPAGCGRKTMATRLAYTLLYGGLSEPILSASELKHPDFHLFSAEGKNSISVDSIRDMITDVYVRPFSAEYKVYVLSDADKMTPSAQNALLKVLEEPPFYAVFILITERLSALLDTVLSRAVKVPFSGATEEELRHFIEKEYPGTDSAALAAAAGGSIGKARALAADTHLGELQNQSADMLMMVLGNDDTSIFSAEKFLNDQKEQVDFILSFWMDLLRDALQEQNHTGRLIYQSYREQSGQLAGRLSLKAIVVMIQALHSAQEMLTRYINLREVIMGLLIQMREDRNE